MPELDPNSNPLSRVELLRLAQGLGVVDADVMTRAELRAAIDKAQRPERAPVEQHPVTWVSVARRLLASVVERGLNLPDAAALIRGDTRLMAPPKAPPPVATVTLARIYAAQGHLDRAIGTLDEVLESDPDHELARDLRDQLVLRRSELAERSGDNLTPLPPPVASVDPAAELVAPPFDTASRQALVSETSESPTLEAQALDERAREEARPLVSRAKSIDGGYAVAEAPPGEELAPPTAPSVAAEPEPPATLATGIDWQRANDAASTEIIPEIGAGAWSAADSADAQAGIEPEAWELRSDESAGSRARAAEAGDVTTAAVAEAPEAVPGAAPAGDATAFAEGAIEHAAASSESAPGAVTGPDALASPENPVEGGGAVAPIAAATEASASEAPATETTGAETVETEAAARAGAAPLAGPGSDGVSELPTSEALAAGDASLNGALSAPGATGAPGGVPAPLPSAPGLLLIETDTPIRYIYWELAGTATPHWIHVVSHTPTGRGGTERRERRFPVHRQLGALRLEGVPRQAVLRAKLTHAPDDARPLVVAGAVRPLAPGGGESFEVRYAPHAKASPEALAGRARPLLERASPIYWDS